MSRKPRQTGESSVQRRAPVQIVRLDEPGSSFHIASVKTGPSAKLCEGQLVAQLRTFCCPAQSEAGLAQIGRSLSAVTRGVTRRKSGVALQTQENCKTLAG